MLVAFFSVAAASHADPHVLEIEAAPASVVVAPSQIRRNTLRLPQLEYAFRLRARCGAPYQPASATLAIADTRRTISAEALATEDADPEMTLVVPANQLSPVPIADFCQDTQDEGPQADEPLTLRAMLSAGASLICATEEQREITYASASLDVLVTCERDAPYRLID